MTGRCFGECHSDGTTHRGKKPRQLLPKIQHSKLRVADQNVCALSWVGTASWFYTASFDWMWCVTRQQCERAEVTRPAYVLIQQGGESKFVIGLRPEFLHPVKILLAAALQCCIVISSGNTRGRIFVNFNNCYEHVACFDF